jgi:hypothetical protein
VDCLAHGDLETIDTDAIEASVRRTAARWIGPSGTSSICPLFGLSLEVDKVDLGYGLTIEPFPADEKTQCWGEWETTGMFPLKSFARCQAKLQGTAGQMNLGERRFFNAAYDAITSLRLLHAGAVGGRGCVTVGELPYLGMGRIGTHLSASRLPDTSFLADYTLSAGDVSDLQKLFRRLFESHSGPPALRTAIRRFNQSYERPEAEDRIIDFAIALESSLLCDMRDELQYRLALRGARPFAVDSGAPGDVRLSAHPL